jgi:hypothetical protein
MSEAPANPNVSKRTDDKMQKKIKIKILVVA